MLRGALSKAPIATVTLIHLMDPVVTMFSSRPRRSCSTLDNVKEQIAGTSTNCRKQNRGKLSTISTSDDTKSKQSKSSNVSEHFSEISGDESEILVLSNLK